MKKSIFKYIIPGLLLMGAFVGCKKNNLVVDKDPLVAPEAARFIISPGVSTNTYNYFILQNPAPGSKYDLPIGVTTVSTAERKVKLTYSSATAVKGTHYTAPDEIVIPAGASTATLSVQGLFAAYAGNRSDNVKIKITSADGYVKPNAYKDSVILVIQQYCPVDFMSMAGTYTRTYEGTYGPYPSTLINLTSTGATTGTATLTNIYDSGISGTINFDWTTPGAFKITIPSGQATPYTSGGLPLLLRANPSNTGSTFNSCNNTLTLYLQLYTTAGVYDTWTMTMAR